jgi:hypothetical protein
MARRTTFYGMHEIGVREPGGHFVVFAQRLDRSTAESRRGRGERT